MVPEETVVERQGRHQVFEVIDQRLRLREVEIGGTRSGFAIVARGLAGGEILVRLPTDDLSDGARVRVK